MKRLLLLLLLLPVIGMSQTKNVINLFRIFPKIDKSLEFEKAFKAHAEKYHTGDRRWRVYEIQTGPDAGGFLVLEGPLSWKQFDKRGNLGDAHTQDWAGVVSPNTADRGTSIFRAPIAERYNSANGANSWLAYLKDYSTAIEKRWNEILFLRADLDSK